MWLNVRANSRYKISKKSFDLSCNSFLLFLKGLKWSLIILNQWVDICTKRTIWAPSDIRGDMFSHILSVVLTIKYWRWSIDPCLWYHPCGIDPCFCYWRMFVVLTHVCGIDPCLWYWPVFVVLTRVCGIDPCLWYQPMFVELTHVCGIDPCLWYWPTFVVLQVGPHVGWGWASTRRATRCTRLPSTCSPRCSRTMRTSLTGSAFVHSGRLE